MIFVSVPVNVIIYFLQEAGNVALKISNVKIAPKLFGVLTLNYTYIHRSMRLLQYCRPHDPFPVQLLQLSVVCVSVSLRISSVSA